MKTLFVMLTEIAAMYGVSTATISSIKHNTRWPTKGNA